jgi:biopolymer transport protein TolR
MGADVGGGDAAKSEPNVVPLCDILLVLLIIFMVVTPMIQKGANVKLPEAVHTQDEPEPGKMATIFVKKDGTFMFDGKVLENLEKLAVQIEDKITDSKQEDKAKVLLKADVGTPYGKIVDAMEEIKNANIEVVGLVTEKVSR